MKLQEVASNLSDLTSVVTALFAFLTVFTTLAIVFYFSIRKKIDRERAEWLREKATLETGHQDNRMILEDHEEQLRTLQEKKEGEL